MRPAAAPEAGQLTVFGKGGKNRAVLVPAALWSDLLELRDGGASEGPVFASRRKTLVGTESALMRRVVRPLDLSMINLIVAQAARAAGLGKKVSPHWMRHAHASQALDSGTRLHVLQATLGHSSFTTTSRYVHVRPDDSSSLYLPQRPGELNAWGAASGTDQRDAGARCAGSEPTESGYTKPLP